MYIHTIVISLRPGGRKNVNRHIISPKIMCILTNGEPPGAELFKWQGAVFISRERAFCDFRTFRNFNIMYIGVMGESAASPNGLRISCARVGPA